MNASAAIDSSAPDQLSRAQEYVLAVTVAVVTANAYYIHPIIGEVAASFDVGEARIGIVPALNQLALALGIFLLLPLGDRYPNRSLCILFVALQSVFMLGMALAEDFALFTAASTLLGFVTIAPYLIPAFASKRVAPERLGQVTALLTVGVIFGILVARVGAGVVAERLGWRAVYWCAFALMAAVTLALPLAMKSEGGAAKRPAGSYGALLASVFALGRRHPGMLVSAAIQGLNFAMFTATWLALALHLTSPELGYGVDTVGYLAGLAAVSIVTTPRLGRLADRIGALRARVMAAGVQAVGLALLYPLGWSAWGIAVPLVVVNMVGPTIDVTGRMTFLALEPAIRTRLTTVYIVVMFLGGALGSLLGPAVYDWAGWAGTSAMLVACSLCVVALSTLSLRAGDRGRPGRNAGA
ncbi:MFS transporter [Erythrobacter sp. HL-111]|uniref:MFS transporter n=1 Tax=Erythrobacter sp. HL-111 TaxID=1798193 RepID=UPI0006DA3945|nr:MFS transporter [Erythrobacter sp. HL-111]KPP96664.1 MAG: proline/glycine-betaine transporter ProP [Erythrobacteraceae bacterium HL-111]SDR98283.1 Predicted arabinose efflux permease, MFS family [Erythrobacter sp. HL-111]